MLGTVLIQHYESSIDRLSIRSENPVQMLIINLKFRSVTQECVENMYTEWNVESLKAAEY